jgi:oxygen-dependent protoporphyrinogen oxidase
MTHVVVVGGGIAGLVAARELLLGGATVTLVEASDHLGGSVTRHTVGGISLDAGAESFATRGGTVADLVRSLGLGDEIVAPNPEGAWLQPASGPAVPMPAVSLLGIPGSPMAADVIAVLGAGAAFRAFARDSLLPGTVGAELPTLGALVRRRMGPEVVDRIVAPIVQGIHSADPDDLDVDRVAPHLRAALRRTGSLARAVQSIRESAPAGSAVAGLRGGITRIVDELVADIARFGGTVRLGARVTHVERDLVRLGDEVIDGRVVLATAWGEASGSPSNDTRVVTLATLVVDSPALDSFPRGTGMLVAEGHPTVHARALTHATAKWPWLAERAAGKHVLRLSYREDPVNLAELARVDAAALLGVDLPPMSVVDFARVQWRRPAIGGERPPGVIVVGETIAGTGLANIIGHSVTQARLLLTEADG